MSLNLSSPVSLSSFSLTVRNLRWSDYDKAIDVMDSWSKTAYERGDQLRDSEICKRLQDCGLMSEQVRSMLIRLPNVVEDDHEISICIDREENWQAIISFEIEDDKIYIAKLVSNPTNIEPRVIGSKHLRENPVKGAGSALVFLVMSRAIELNKKNIYLRSLPTAVGFYEKLGFSRDTDQPFRTSVSMQLTSEKIQALYPHLIIPKLAA